MIYLITIILVACVTGKLEVFSFGAKVHGTALIQLNASCIVIGTSKGELGFYSPKGQVISEFAHLHKAEIVGI